VADWYTGKLVSDGATLATVTPFQKNVHSLDNLSYSQIIRSPRNAGKGHIFLKWCSSAIPWNAQREAACGGSIPSLPSLLGAVEPGSEAMAPVLL